MPRHHQKTRDFKRLFHSNHWSSRSPTTINISVLSSHPSTTAAFKPIGIGVFYTSFSSQRQHVLSRDVTNHEVTTSGDRQYSLSNTTVCFWHFWLVALALLPQTFFAQSAALEGDEVTEDGPEDPSSIHERSQYRAEGAWTFPVTWHSMEVSTGPAILLYGHVPCLSATHNNWQTVASQGK
jgi:ureidoglycolate hydrolase